MISAPDLACDAGITYRQLDHWVDLSYLFPEERCEGAGSGIPREFSDHEAAIARLMGLLVSQGLRPGKAHEVARMAVDNQTSQVRLGDSFWVHLPAKMVRYGRNSKKKVDTA